MYAYGKDIHKRAVVVCMCAGGGGEGRGRGKGMFKDLRDECRIHSGRSGTGMMWLLMP